MIYFEYCPKVNKRCGNLIPADALESLVGFRSVFGFDEHTAQIIKQSHSSKGLSAYPVTTCEIAFDWDDCKDGAYCCLEQMKQLNVPFKFYFTGNRGYHLHITTELDVGQDIPARHKHFAKSLNVGADLSLYKHSSLLRLPGTIHEKTGKPKMLIEQNLEGSALKIPELPENGIKKPLVFDLAPLTSPEDLRWVIGDMHASWFKAPEVGNRHALIWRTALRMREGGLSYECALELLLHMNRSWGDRAKVDSEVARAVRDGYHWLKETI
jgi:hypothetical protein